jgi:hypothetical protein
VSTVVLSSGPVTIEKECGLIAGFHVRSGDLVPNEEFKTCHDSKMI